MSRNEGEEGEELLVWRVILCLKVMPLWRVTVMREGMSVGEDRVIGSTLQSDGTRIEECITGIAFNSEWGEFRQVYSLLHFIIITSHYQFSWFITLELESSITKSNGSQFRQVYSSFSFWKSYSQTLHENNRGMHLHQTEVISNWACLFIIPFFHNHSSIPRKHNRNCHSIHSNLPFQSVPKKAHSQSHTQNNQRRNNNPSSVLLVSHNSSNGNDNVDHT